MNSKKVGIGLLVLAIVSMFGYIYTSIETSKQSYTIKNGMIYFAEPERAEGQTSMLGFAAEPIDTVRVGIIGLGMRG